MTEMQTDLGFYISLVWLFVIIITLLLLVVCYLFLAMRSSIERESRSLAFSHLVIEGIETERRRISRELHDTVLPLVKNSEVSNIVRSICLDLMPPDFTRLSLSDSLAQFCDQFTIRTGIKCACSIEEKLDFTFMSAENQLHIYRMVQESFTNIEKHSKAKRAFLVIRYIPQGDKNNILLCVSDEGIGLKNLPFENEGFGMRSIRQRAVIIGAKLDFISESGNGLTVRLEISNV